MDIVCSLITVYIVIIFIRIVLTWFPLDPEGPMATVAGFLFMVTDPVLGPVRRVLPALRVGGVALDLSPILVVIGLRVLQGIICS